MRRLPVALATALLAGACQDAPNAPAADRARGEPLADAAAAPTFTPATLPADDVVPGRWLVLLKDGATGAGIPAAADAAGAPAANRLVGAPGTTTAVARLRARIAESDGAVLETFAGEVQGMAAALTPEAAAALREDPAVAAVEPDRWLHATNVQPAASWGIDRVDQRPLPLDGAFRYASDGAGVKVFVFDTGIEYDHPEFGGRAERGADFVTLGGSAADCHGHGTLAASLVGGRAYGVARGARLVAVRVLGCSMSGSMAAAISGLNWVMLQKRMSPSTPMIVSMSLAGSTGSTLFDMVVNQALRAGITIIVSAGNTDVDACRTSPSRVPGVITVGATDASDRYAGFASWGSCVDVSAPGVGVKGAWRGGGTLTASGTSVSAPLVAGAAALYLSKNRSASPAQVQSALASAATAGRIAALPTGTPNRLLFTAW